LLKGEEVAKQAARNFLATDNPHVNKEAFCSCLDLLKGEEIAKQAARKFLATDNPHANFSAFCSCLQILDIEMENEAIKILENHTTEKNWSFVYHSLRIVGKSQKHLQLLSTIASEICKNKKEDTNKYKELLKIPLFNIPMWVKETKYLIDNWESQTGFRRNYLYSITISYEKFPDKLIKMSIGIIRNWENELSVKTKHKAYFTRSLANINVDGNENLRKEAIQICRDIETHHLKSPLNLTPDLEIWIKKIATTGEFPVWMYSE
jgi:hypothetical protein